MYESYHLKLRKHIYLYLEIHIQYITPRPRQCLFGIGRDFSDNFYHRIALQNLIISADMMCKSNNFRLYFGCQ